MMYGFQHWLRHTLSHVVHEESRAAMRYTRTITNPKEIMYVASRVQNCEVCSCSCFALSASVMTLVQDSARGCNVLSYFNKFSLDF